LIFQIFSLKHYSETNLKACKDLKLEAIIPDSQYKKRLGAGDSNKIGINDFEYKKRGNYYKCPNGKKLKYKRDFINRNIETKVYIASVKDCRICLLMKKCINTKKGRDKIVTGR
jgi:hypothetical protein